MTIVASSAIETPWIPTAADFRQAMQRVRDHIDRTPLFRCRELERDGRRVFIKLENLQRTGAFKVRGAFNAVSSKSDAELERGVVTNSSGNFAQALALAAREVGIERRGRPYECTICMTERSCPEKVRRTQQLGGKVRFGGQTSEDLRLAARTFAVDSGAVYISPYDDRDVICGQGTIGLEVLEQFREATQSDQPFGTFVGPVGGGGLLSGIASALRSHGYAGAIIGMEPAIGNDTQQSLLAGHRVAIDYPDTLCDGLKALTPGELTFPILRASGVTVQTLDDATTLSGLMWLSDWKAFDVEPSGAISVAAWQSQQLEITEPGDIVLLVSGGNSSEFSRMARGRKAAGGIN